MPLPGKLNRRCWRFYGFCSLTEHSGHNFIDICLRLVNDLHMHYGAFHDWTRRLHGQSA